MSRPANDAGVSSPDTAENLAVTIRHCIATPSRVVLFFDGAPDGVAAAQAQNYAVGVASGTLHVGRGSAEYDASARVTVLRNLADDVEVGDWLQVEVSRLGSPGQFLTYYARVQSELPLVQTVFAGDVGAREAAEGDREATSMRPDAPVAAKGPSVQQDMHLPTASKRTRGIERTSAFELTPALVVVLTGLVALVVLGIAAMILASAGDMSTIATAAFGVIGSVIGAFFGVHAGLGDRERIDTERRLEATKGQMLAAMVPDAQKEEALGMLKDYASGPPSRSD